MKTRIRTGYWSSEFAVRNYYGGSADSALSEGRAIVGKPELKRNWVLLVDSSTRSSNGQYIIERDD